MCRRRALYEHTSIDTYIIVYMYVYALAYAYTNICGCVVIHLFICVHICTYIYTYMHIFCMIDKILSINQGTIIKHCFCRCGISFVFSSTLPTICMRVFSFATAKNTIYAVFYLLFKRSFRSYFSRYVYSLERPNVCVTMATLQTDVVLVAMVVWSSKPV